MPIKNDVYPPMILSFILFSTLLITGGAVDTGKKNPEARQA